MAVLRGGSTVGGSPIVTKQDVPMILRESGGRLQFYDGSTWKNVGTDTSDANAVAAEILTSKTAYVNDVKITGTMPIVGTFSTTLTTQGGQSYIPAGFHNGAGVITASFANLVAGNIKSGVNVGGVVGTLPQTTVAPTTVIRFTRNSSKTTSLSCKVYVNGTISVRAYSNYGAEFVHHNYRVYVNNVLRESASQTFVNTSEAYSFNVVVSVNDIIRVEAEASEGSYWKASTVGLVIFYDYVDTPPTNI